MVDIFEDETVEVRVERLKPGAERRQVVSRSHVEQLDSPRTPRTARGSSTILVSPDWRPFCPDTLRLSPWLEDRGAVEDLERNDRACSNVRLGARGVGGEDVGSCQPGQHGEDVVAEDREIAFEDILVVGIEDRVIRHLNAVGVEHAPARGRRESDVSASPALTESPARARTVARRGGRPGRAQLEAGASSSHTTKHPSTRACDPARERPPQLGAMARRAGDGSRLLFLLWQVRRGMWNARSRSGSLHGRLGLVTLPTVVHAIARLDWCDGKSWQSDGQLPFSTYFQCLRWVKRIAPPVASRSLLRVTSLGPGSPPGIVAGDTGRPPWAPPT